ncbi:MAG: hypothetical protein ACKOD9_01640, partial [Rubrivivax sp.]
AKGGFDPSKALMMIERGAVQVAMSLQDEITPVRALFERYDKVPASLADACLIRLAELHEPSRILTLDGDFRIYRRHGRKAIALITPG